MSPWLFNISMNDYKGGKNDVKRKGIKNSKEQCDMDAGDVSVCGDLVPMAEDVEGLRIISENFQFV